MKAYAAGLGVVVALLGLWHLAGWESPPREAGYPYTQWVTGCVGIGFAVAFIVAMFCLGWQFGRAWAIGLANITPLAVAMVLEMMQDSTSHNLFPFEIVLMWIPAFLVSFGIAQLGSWTRRRMRG